MVRIVALTISMLLPALAAAETSSWSIDPAHSSSSFGVKHLVVTTVRGLFGKTTGTLQLDEKDITRSKVEATIDVDSIDTRVADRDNHLKSADFFDVANHPTITFESTKVQRAGRDKLKVTGDLRIKGKTKPVVLDVTFPAVIVKGMRGESRRGLSATTKIDRREFGLTWSKMTEAGPLVGNQVSIAIDLELEKGPPEEKKQGDEKAKPAEKGKVEQPAKEKK